MAAKNDSVESSIRELFTPEVLLATKFYPPSPSAYVKINVSTTCPENIDPCYTFILTFRQGITAKIPPEIEHDNKAFVYILNQEQSVIGATLVLIEHSNALAVKPLLPLRKGCTYTIVVDFKHQTSLALGRRLKSMHKTFVFKTKDEDPSHYPNSVLKIKSESCLAGSPILNSFHKDIKAAISCPAFFLTKRVIVCVLNARPMMVYLKPGETLALFLSRLHNELGICEIKHELRAFLILSVMGDNTYALPIVNDLYLTTAENNDVILVKVVERKQEEPAVVMEKELTIDEKIQKKFEDAESNGNLFDLTSCEDD